MNEQTLLVTAEEAARRLGLSRSRVYLLMSSGELESLKMGRSRRVPVQALEAFVAQQRGSS